MTPRRERECVDRSGTRLPTVTSSTLTWMGFLTSLSFKQRSANVFNSKKGNEIKPKMSDLLCFYLLYTLLLTFFTSLKKENSKRTKQIFLSQNLITARCPCVAITHSLAISHFVT